ncbi:hypothetical protein [Streptosporangium sp. NBC_01756]|uniref:hypothetical protein n=1 Tax=Streptosporangium sp. NBC_01756 TaxID=2975950 RepID=UPI002DDC197B|nr:hypothetical protein [Streptosporangium sp. NBC_01756]WSC84059.1 hypothetical protein OIE48_27170 [Streptosporangium sp. NBC_01756]
MGKFDGMDPKLVRDLLSEVKQVAAEMREAETRITQLMSRAGLSSHSSHRPAQIADSGDAMVRDVTARVTLLEKKIKHDVSPPAEPQAGEPKTDGAKPDTGSEAKSDPKSDGGATAKQDAKPDAPKVEDLKPAVPKGDEGAPSQDRPQSQDQSAGDQPKDGTKPDSGADAKQEAKPDPKPDSGADAKQDAKSDAPKVEDLKPAVPKGDEGAPSQDRPQSQDQPSDGRPKDDVGSDSRSSGADVKPDTGSKGDERSSRDGGGTGGVEVVTDPGSRGENVSGGADVKPDTGSKGDERSSRDGGGTGGVEVVTDPGARDENVSGGADVKPDTGSKGDERSSRDGGGTGGVEVVTDPGARDENVSGGADVKPDTGSKGDERSPRDGGDTGGVETVDTAQKDHPDDLDQHGDMKPRVVAVDGVQVLQIPLDSPTAAEVTELLKNIEDIPPLDMPTTDGVSDAVGVPSDRIEPDRTSSPDDFGVSIPDTVEPVPDQTIQPPGTGGEPDAPSVDTRPDGGAMPSPSETTVGESAAWWTDDGTDVVSVQTAPPDTDAIRTLADNARDIEPMDMPSVQVPDGETWGEGAWTSMDIGPDGEPGDLDPGDPSRPIPPPGGRSDGQ